MAFMFATCCTKMAEEFIQRVYPNAKVNPETPAMKAVLDLVGADIIRIQDPMMHGTAPQVVAGTHWDESRRDEIAAACKAMHDELMAQAESKDGERVQ